MAIDQFTECFVERGEDMLELIGRAMGKSIAGGREVTAGSAPECGLGRLVRSLHRPIAWATALFSFRNSAAVLSGYLAELSKLLR